MSNLFQFIHSYLVIIQLKHINDNLRISDHIMVNYFSTC